VKICHEMYRIVGDQVKLTMEAVFFKISKEFSKQHMHIFELSMAVIFPEACS